MPWIKVIPEEKAEGYLSTLYKKYGDPFSGVANIIKIHSLNPDAMRHHYELYRHLMFGESRLSRMQREMLAVVVSKLNACHY
jgi:alkylhydroperoxidase family enzyme